MSRSGIYAIQMKFSKELRYFVLNNEFTSHDNIVNGTGSLLATRVGRSLFLQYLTISAVPFLWMSMLLHVCLRCDVTTVQCWAVFDYFCSILRWWISTFVELVTWLVTRDHNYKLFNWTFDFKVYLFIGFKLQSCYDYIIMMQLAWCCMFFSSSNVVLYFNYYWTVTKYFYYDSVLITLIVNVYFLHLFKCRLNFLK